MAPGDILIDNYKTGGAYADNSATAIIEYADTTTVGSAYKTKLPVKIFYDNGYGGTGEITAKDIYRMWRSTTTSTAFTWNDISTWYDCKWERANRRIMPEEQLRDIIRSRQAPAFIRSRKTIDHASDPREFRARETLRRVLGDDKYQKFIRDGFVSVRAKSGLIYQIFPGHGMTNVFDRGVQTERLCVVLRGNFPPTDSLIMRYLLILNDERDFRRHAIEHSFSQRNQRQQSNDQIIKPLNEVWKGLKVA